MNLYELTSEWENVFNMLNDPEIPDDVVFDTIEMIEADMDTKADNYAKIIKNMEGDAAKIDTEIKRLQARKAAVINRGNWLKIQLEDAMRRTGKTKFKTVLFSFGIQKNGGAVPVELTGDVPEVWRKPGEPDMTAIRQYLQSGAELDFAKLGERGESLRIR